MLEHVRESSPRYGDLPSIPKLDRGDDSEPIRLDPFVIRGAKPRKLTESPRYTRRRLADFLRRHCHNSAYAGQQYRDDKRLEDMADLKGYTDNLKLAGDISGSRDIEKEFARLFMRGHHD